jgi:hypothetical protein
VAGADEVSAIRETTQSNGESRRAGERRRAGARRRGPRRAALFSSARRPDAQGDESVEVVGRRVRGARRERTGDGVFVLPLPRGGKSRE